MAQPTVTTVTETYEGQSITCAKIVATETSTQQFTNVATSNDDQYFQIVIKTESSDKTVSFTLGGVTKTKTITTSFDKYTIGFPDTNVLNSKHLTMSIPAGTQYVYNLQLERGLYPSQWRPAPEDSADYTDASSASTLSSAQTYADGAAASAVSGQTQQDIFNKLTDNGTVQGIVLQNGQLYINGAYIQAGTIVSTGLDSTTQTKIDNGDTANSRAVACRGTCSTAATTAAKVVTSANFSLVSGATITVYFSTANTKADAALTLNVNSTGAKTIYVAGAATSSTNQLVWVAGSSITFTYDGTQQRVENDAGTYYCGTCSTAAATGAKTATCSGAIIFRGASIQVPMTNANTATSVTLNIASLGAKNVYYGTSTGVPTTANGHGWIAGRTATFWFDGSVYRLQESSTIIDGGHITTGTIDASKVTVNNLNASNISSGTLSASRISGGTLTLGGSNNTNGSLTVLNASSSQVAKIDNTGLTATAGSIAGWTIGSHLLSYAGREWSNSSTTTAGVVVQTVDSSNLFSPQFSLWDSTFSTTINTGGFWVNARYNSHTPSTSYPNAFVTAGGITSLATNINSSATYYSCVLKYNHRFIVSQGTGAGSGTEVIAYNSSGVKLGDHETGILYLKPSSRVQVNGNFSVSGTKNRLIKTEEYSDRLLYCYETASPMFGDIGEGKISDDGLAYIWLDPVFAQTITTDGYQVYLQKYGDGDIYVSERKHEYFIVAGTPNLSFGWEIKARQLGYDQKRLANANSDFIIPEESYGEQASEYIQNIHNGRLE